MTSGIWLAATFWAGQLAYLALWLVCLASALDLRRSMRAIRESLVSLERGSGPSRARRAPAE